MVNGDEAEEDEEEDDEGDASENSMGDSSTTDFQPSRTRSTHVRGFSRVLVFPLVAFPAFLLLDFWLAFFFMIVGFVVILH
mmetsp:Transcript_106114/g.305092  ORF Transcript_106114/g.305092 Transcript_106114/m.305092 type:complete len:81 (+) Transcript_106114:465-707(+)